MTKVIVTSFFLLGFAQTALAADSSKFFVTVDTVGNCSVIQSTPSGKPSVGKTAIGDEGGYPSIEAAKKYLDEIRNDESKCKGVVAG